MKYYGPKISDHLQDFLLKRYSSVVVFSYAKDDDNTEFVKAFVSNAQKIVVACEVYGDDIHFYENTFSNSKDLGGLLSTHPVYKTNINNFQDMFYIC
jgi:hypothetical protein